MKHQCQHHHQLFRHLLLHLCLHFHRYRCLYKVEVWHLILLHFVLFLFQFVLMIYVLPLHWQTLVLFLFLFSYLFMYLFHLLKLILHLNVILILCFYQMNLVLLNFDFRLMCAYSWSYGDVYGVFCGKSFYLRLCFVENIEDCCLSTFLLQKVSKKTLNIL